MKNCERCGELFEPKYANVRLCISCFIESEHAFDTVAELKRENASLWTKIQRLESSKPRKQRAKESATISAIPADVLKLLVLLAHPDKHDNSPAATKATAWLLNARKQ